MACSGDLRTSEMAMSIRPVATTAVSLTIFSITVTNVAEGATTLMCWKNLSLFSM